MGFRGSVLGGQVAFYVVVLCSFVILGVLFGGRETELHFLG